MDHQLGRHTKVKDRGQHPMGSQITTIFSTTYLYCMSDDLLINKFVGKYSFLNNFYASSIWIDGKRYPTCEHAYQAYKTLNESSRETIRASKDPMTAKKLGRGVELRPDWEDVRINLMRDFVRKKFESPFLSDMLLKTGKARLVHENSWNDKFWGVCRGVGLNWLGIILMEIREEIFDSVASSV